MIPVGPSSPPPPARPASSSRRIVLDTRRRDTVIAVGVGAALLALIFYAVFYFSQQAGSAGGVTGVITRKEFVSQPETQVSFGPNGLSSRQIDGQYVLDVCVPEDAGRVYRVFVSQADFETHHEADHYYFVRPMPGK